MRSDPPRVPVPGAALARLMARIAGRTPIPPGMPPADLLGDWLEWQRAVALSRALDEEPGVDAPPAADTVSTAPSPPAASRQ